VMPADSSLGKFSADFAGRLGMIEEYPNVPKTVLGFGGATKIIDSDELLHLMNANAKEHVDALAFLAARLTDFLINDNDRHSGQWKWARLESGPKTQWQPIARDRDHALIGYDGVLLRLAGMAEATLVPFDQSPNVPGLTWPREFDARLLSGLDKSVWDSVAVAIQREVTNAVIDSAVAAMPAEYSASGAKLKTVLIGRRDALPKAATQYYRMLSARVVVHGTDSSDRATITRVSDGVVDVRLESEGKTFFSRRFDAHETSELLVDLHGGDDTAVVTGSVQRSIALRIIGGNGSNTFIDSSTVGGERNAAHLYDRGTVTGVSYGPDTMFDRRPWEKTNGVLAPPLADAGARYAPIVGISDRRGVGITPRIGMAKYTYGFRRRPYQSLVKVEGEYATQFRGGASAFQGIGEWSRLRSFSRRRQGCPTSRWSTTTASATRRAIRAARVRTSPCINGSGCFTQAVGLAIGSATSISLGPVIQHSVTDDARSPYLAASRPYGVGSFTQAAMQLGARYEWRAVPDSEEHTHHRVLVELDELYFPAVMDVRSAFRETILAIGTSVTIPLPTKPLFIIRTGGKKLNGTFPFYEGASIGGESTTRYEDPERYLGDASLYATTELRIPLAEFLFVVPLRMGVMGVAEAGRVYVSGSSPGGWHTRTGEGVWFGQGTASPIVTIMRTTEPGHTGIGLGLGLNF
jgi:hypothetical protein